MANKSRFDGCYVPYNVTNQLCSTFGMNVAQIKVSLLLNVIIIVYSYMC